jgi:hypothetical protein
MTAPKGTLKADYHKTKVAVFIAILLGAIFLLDQLVQRKTPNPKPKRAT